MVVNNDLLVGYSLDYDLIWSLINRQGISMKSLSEFCEMSPDGLSRALRKQRISVETLEKIALFFQKHPGYFWGPDENQNVELLSKLKMLNLMIEEKTKQLKDKEEIIRLLKSQLK